MSGSCILKPVFSSLETLKYVLKYFEGTTKTTKLGNIYSQLCEVPLTFGIHFLIKNSNENEFETPIEFSRNIKLLKN